MFKSVLFSVRCSRFGCWDNSDQGQFQNNSSILEVFLGSLKIIVMFINGKLKTVQLRYIILSVNLLCACT